MRNFFAAVMAAALLTVTAAQAASDSPSASLAPGKAAGLRQAQDDGNDALFYLLGAAAIAAGIAILASDNGHDRHGGSPPTSSPSTQ